jgi:integrase
MDIEEQDSKSAKAIEPAIRTARLFMPLLQVNLYQIPARPFCSGKTKKALSERALGYIVKKFAQAAKLPDVRPHDLRHRFGYRMAGAVPLHR